MNAEIKALPEGREKRQNGFSDKGKSLFDEILQSAQKEAPRPDPEPARETYTREEVEREYFDDVPPNTDTDAPTFDDIPDQDAEPEGEEFNFADGAGPQEDREGERQQDGQRTDAARQTAKFHAATCKMFIPQICAAIDGSPNVTSDRYNIWGEKDWENYEEISYEFFKTVAFRPSPGLYFMFATASMFAGPVWSAFQARKARQEMEHKRRERAEKKAAARRREEAAAAAAGAGMQSALFDEEPPEPYSAAERSEYSNLKEVQEGRRYFQTDKKGLYKYDLDRNYIKTKDRNERASSVILELKRQGVTDNQEILEHLGVD